MRRSLTFMSVIILFTIMACTEKNTFEFTDLPVIESYLSPGEHPLVKISRQIPFDSSAVFSGDDVNSLEIRIINNNNVFVLTSLGDGKYIDSTLVIKAGERYDLTFRYNSMTVSAYTTIPSKPVNFTGSSSTVSVMNMGNMSGPPTGGWQEMVPLDLKWNNEDGSYYIVVVENYEKKLSPIRDFGGNEPIGLGRFRKMPVISSGIEIRPMEFRYFGKHHIILNHVLPDYASLYNETSTSSQNLTNPSSSIINGYGIFTGLNSDTIDIVVRSLK
ncbi:MAG TPA: DUF4249 family protein [Bacteroidales bacterium]|nr:DUF4249 family protein [Bacteroidales bacterium]